MSSAALLLKMYDEAWSHPCESVSAVLKDLAPEEAAWQHAAYAREDPWPGMPLPGTILWQVAHLEHSARHYAYILRNRPVTQEPETPPPTATDLGALRSALERAHGELRGSIAELSDSALSEPCARGWDVGEFVRMMIRHNVWHAGQIAVVRRLFHECARAEGRKSGSSW